MRGTSEGSSGESQTSFKARKNDIQQEVRSERKPVSMDKPLVTGDSTSRLIKRERAG